MLTWILAYFWSLPSGDCSSVPLGSVTNFLLNSSSSQHAAELVLHFLWEASTDSRRGRQREQGWVQIMVRHRRHFRYHAHKETSEVVKSWDLELR